MTKMSLETALRRLERAERRAESLEHLIEDKSRELFAAAQQVEASRAELEEIWLTTPTALFVCDSELRVRRANAAAMALVIDAASLEGTRLGVALGSDDLDAERLHREVDQSSAIPRLEVVCMRADERDRFPIVVSASRAREPHRGFVVSCLDVRRERQLELELRHAQKLEATGQLAAGIAHEINTPIQFVGDSVYFLQEAFEDVVGVARGTRSADEADLDYLVEHIPEALTRCEQGIGRVAEIVRALKELSHPDGRDKAPADLNRALGNAATVARNETKYVAEVELDLGEIPLVECHVGDVGQVLLNLLVNAAHAVGERASAQGPERGHIRASTTLDPDGASVVVSISDDGAGIPEAVRPRIFEPFFTTKPVGRGTGQGLAIVRSIVVERHGGEIWFDTELGLGTTFYVRLPVRAARGARHERSAA